MADPVSNETPTCEWPAERGYVPSGSAGAEIRWEECGAPSDGTWVSNPMAVTLHSLIVCGEHRALAVASGWKSHPPAGAETRPAYSLAEWLMSGDAVVVDPQASPPITGAPAAMLALPAPSWVLRESAALLAELARRADAPERLVRSWRADMLLAADRLDERAEADRLASLRGTFWSRSRASVEGPLARVMWKPLNRLCTWATDRGYR